MADGAVVWVIGVLLVCIIAVSVVIPGVTTAITGVAVTGTSTEIWAGTAATAHTMNNFPIVAVTTFGKTTNATTAVNTTVLTGNSSANATETPTFLSPFDTGTVSGQTYDINYTAQIGAGGATVNVSVFVGTTKIAEVTSTNSYSATGRAPTEWSPSTVRFQFNGAANSNVTNVSVRYGYFAANTAYTTASAVGTITPTATGTYYTTYSYGTMGTTAAGTMLNLIPFLVAVVLIMLVIGTGMYQWGG